VLLPYDEHYLGLTAETLRRTSPRMFAFMAHDRGTLAGTMLGLGWLYVALAWQGVRRGRHGARTVVIASALAGFASFFAFFGFGYFDTLHAFVAAVLFQLTVQIMIGEEGGEPAPLHVIDDEDSAWRSAQWGQLLWVVHASGLLIAGAVILGIGVTSVFVSEDLKFLCMTEAQAQELGAKMTGVVAHDRATLGGMLLASGVGMLLSVLWCFQRGARWLWWAIAGLGFPAYAAAIAVHLEVGYTDWRHLAPALAGLGLWLGGLLLSRAYLRGA
ncbi:MAG: dihydroorotate dehydrogenase, partial [Oleiharenicola lentus]